MSNVSHINVDGSMVPLSNELSVIGILVLISTLVREGIKAIGETYMLNRRGPSTEPWGTPDSETLRLDEESPSLTYCERFMID